MHWLCLKTHVIKDLIRDKQFICKVKFESDSLEVYKYIMKDSFIVIENNKVAALGVDFDTLNNVFLKRHFITSDISLVKG